MIYFLFFIRVQYSPIPLGADLLYFLYELSPPLAMWILNFMPERPHSLHVNDWLADSVGIPTGSLQGCVLTPFLFILYPNNCRSCHIFTSVVCVCVQRKGQTSTVYQECIHFVPTLHNVRTTSTLQSDSAVQKCE